ncbi:Protein kinase-like domain containing protein [Rhypophila decipiens]
METDLLTALNHPNLIKLKELHSSPTQGAMLILELCECTLDNFFSTNRAARTQPNYHVLQVISQIGSALEFLQSKSIVHRDIKCSNILVRSCSPFHIVLGDFGTAYRASTWRTATSKPHGTVAYMAPEIFDTRITRADDGWI